MTHNFSVKNNGGVKVGLRDRNEIIKLTGATTLTRDWDLNTNGITPYETYCTIYCYAIFKLNGHKLKYFGYEVDDKYALKPHKVVAVNVRDKWKIEVSLISLVGGPATTPPGSAKDEKVKVASGDPTAGYLIQKIKHGPEILLSTSILDPDSWALKILNAGPFTRNLIDGRIEQRFPGYPLYFKTGESILFQASSQAITNFQNVASTVNWKGDHTVISAFAIHEYLNSDTYMHHWHKEADIKDLDRMRWAHPWHLKTMVNPYVKNDVVTEGDWLMIANKPTIDHAAPQEIGSPIYAATDAPAFLLEHHTAVVRSGQHYGFKKVGQIKEIRAWVPEIHANIHHKFIVIDDSDPTNPEIVGTVISKADEWEIIIDYNKTIAVGDKLLIIVETTYDHQPTKFSQQKTYWPTNHVGFADIHGHLEFDGHPQPGQEVTDSLFGIDIQFQELSISPDWDVLASSSGGTSSGGGGTPTVVSHPAVIDRDVPNSHPSLAIDHHFPRTTNLPGDLDYLKNLIDNKVTVVSPAVANNIVTLEAGGTLQDSGYSFDTGLAGTVTYWKTYKQLSHEPIMKFKAGYGGVTQVIIGNANNETLPPYSDKQALWIAQNSAFVAGLAMKNWNTGPRASFRFSLFDTAGGYLAFDMPSVNNTSMIFGHRRSTLTWMATIGKSHLRHLAIGTQETSSLIFGTHNLERMTIDKDGKVKINHFETTQGNFVQEVSGILSKRTTAQVKVQLGIVSSIELWKRTSTLLEPKNSGDGVKGGRWILNGNNISIGSTIAFIYSDHTAPFSISTMAGRFLFISLPNAAIDAAPDSSAVTKGWVQSKITPSLWARTGTILSPSTVGDNVKVRNWLIDELSIKFSNLSVLEVNSVSNWLSIGTGSFHGLAILGHDIQFNDLSIANINSGGGKFAVTKEWVLSKIPTVQPYQTLRWVRTTKTLSISHGNSVTLIHNHTWAEVLGKPDVVYTLSGDVTGHITAAVGAAVSIVTTVKNDSHTHAGYMLRSHSAKTDPNTVKVSSGYRFEKHANNPDPVGFYSIVTFGNETNVIGQHAIHFTTGASYTRSFNTAWSPWLRQWSSADFTSTDVTNWNAAHVHSLVVTGNPHHVTWAELLSKPAKFPPSAHTHTHASTTGQTANDHHNQVHELVSSDHTVAGLTAGYVLTALSATTFGFKAITQATAQTLTWVPTTKTLSISHGNSVILNHTHPWSEIIDHPEVLWTKEADRLFPATLSNKVGIGTQNPGAKLEVKDNGTKVAFGTHAHAISDPCIMTSDNRGNLDRIFQRQTSTGSVFVGDIDNNNGSVFVRAAGATYLTIHSSGKVGIGIITTPLHTLDVKGDARISSITHAAASYTGVLVTSVGVIKYRTIEEIKSDLGIVGSTPQTLTWVPATKLLTISQGNHVTLNHTHLWSEITDKPTLFPPAPHGLVSASHTVAGLTAGHVLTALTPTTFGFKAIPATIHSSKWDRNSLGYLFPKTTTDSVYLQSTGSLDPNTSQHITKQFGSRPIFPQYCYYELRVPVDTSSLAALNGVLKIRVTSDSGSVSSTSYIEKTIYIATYHDTKGIKVYAQESYISSWIRMDIVRIGNFVADIANKEIVLKIVNNTISARSINIEIDYVGKSAERVLKSTLSTKKLGTATDLPPMQYFGTPPSAYVHIAKTLVAKADVLTISASGLVGKRTLDELKADLGIHQDIDHSKWTQSGGLLYPKLLTSKVGIGIAIPTEKLDVYGNLKVGDVSAIDTYLKINSRISGGSATLKLQPATGNNTPLLYLIPSGTSTKYPAIFLGTTSGTATGHPLFTIGTGNASLPADRWVIGSIVGGSVSKLSQPIDFYMSNAAHNRHAVMTILNTDRVGIMTTTPVVTLHVVSEAHRGFILDSPGNTAVDFMNSAIFLSGNPGDHGGAKSIAMATSPVANYGITLNTIRPGTDGNPAFSINFHKASPVGIPMLGIDAIGNVKLHTIGHEGADVDRFLVSSHGIIKYRTGAELLKDIGSGTITLTGNVTGSGTTTITTTNVAQNVHYLSGLVLPVPKVYPHQVKYYLARTGTPSAAYHTVIHINPYTGTSTTVQSEQLALRANNMYIRSAVGTATAWGAWVQFADRAWVTAQIIAGEHSPWAKDTHGIHPKVITDKVGIGIAIPTEALEVAGKIKIKDNTLSAESVTFESATNKGLYLRNANGYISLTPFSTGWAHIYTDRSNFIFNKRLIVQGSVPHLSSYHASDLFIAAGNATTAAHAGIKIGHVDQAVTLRNSLTIVRITPSTNPATTYLTSVAGLVMSRTKDDVWKDIGGDIKGGKVHGGLVKTDKGGGWYKIFGATTGRFAGKLVLAATGGATTPYSQTFYIEQYGWSSARIYYKSGSAPVYFQGVRVTKKDSTAFIEVKVNANHTSGLVAYFVEDGWYTINVDYTGNLSPIGETTTPVAEMIPFTDGAKFPGRVKGKAATEADDFVIKSQLTIAARPIWKSTAHIVQLASLTDTEVNLLAAQSLSFGPSSMGNKIHYGTSDNLTIVDGRIWRFTGTLDLASFQFTNKAGTVSSFGTVANGLVDWTSEAQVVSAKAIAAKISSGGGTTPNDGTLSMRGSGILSGSATFSADQAGNSSFTVTHNIGSGFYHVPAGGSRGQILGWHSLGQAGWIAMPAPALPGNGLLTMSATGALSGSATFHANQSTNTTFRVVHNTSSGYKHIPAGGRHGYTLVWASSGTAKWEPPSLDAGYSYWTVRVGSGHGNILNHDTILFSGGTGVDIRASLSRNPRTISFSLKDVNLIINTDRFDTPTAAITAHFTPGATIYLKGAVTSPTGHVVRTGVHSSNTIYFYIQAHSDRRLKKNITVTDPSLAYKLKPSRFTWKDSGLINFGFIAQEVEDAIPEIAFRDKDGTMSYNMPSIPAINNAAIQALKKEIEELKKKLNILLSKS